MPDPTVPGAPRDGQVRPLVWRLPLLGFLLVGLLCLQQLDAMLARGYRSEAAGQAVRMSALLQGAVDQRVSLLRQVEAIGAVARTPADLERRFALFAPQIAAASADLRGLHLIDTTGVVRRVFPVNSAQRRLLGVNLFLSAEPGAALQRARDGRRAAVDASADIGTGERGLLVIQPVAHDGRLVGFIAGAFAHAALVHSALTGRVDDQFSFRVTDDAGNALGGSPVYTPGIREPITRPLGLPDGQHWALAVAVMPFEPFAPRVITWTVGLILLGLAVFLVLREEARTERFALYSLNLETLSRDLIDLNMRLEERAQQVTEANRAKSRFLANVSHELRTPLNAIVGYNALAREGVYGKLPDGLVAANERVHQAAQHLLALVDDVLDLSKIEVGRMAVEREPVEVASVMNDVAGVIEPIASAKDVRVDLVVARDLPSLTTDARHLRQIVLNLATNAVKFTDRGAVTLSAYKDAASDGFVHVAVEDTGIGIAEGDLERIFDEFEQVRPGGRGDSLERGTGLGLAISRKLARLLGGDIAVRSRTGVGSRFTLTIPVEAPSGSDVRNSGGGGPVFRQRDDSARREPERRAPRTADAETAPTIGEPAPFDQPPRAAAELPPRTAVREARGRP